MKSDCRRRQDKVAPLLKYRAQVEAFRRFEIEKKLKKNRLSVSILKSSELFGLWFAESFENAARNKSNMKQYHYFCIDVSIEKNK